MPGSFGARAAAVLRDPWSMLVTGVGAGSAWALGLPAAGVALVGAGMLGAAVVTGVLARRQSEPEQPLARGTAQRSLVDQLDSYRADLEEFQRGPLPPALTMTAGNAVSAAEGAAATARRVASAVDALDSALARAHTLARRMPQSAEVRGTVERMAGRRAELLGRLTVAVHGVGEIYAGLLELSATAQLAGLGTADTGEVSGVNDSLVALRAAFDELERDASAARPLA